MVLIGLVNPLSLPVVIVPLFAWRLTLLAERVAKVNTIFILTKCFKKIMPFLLKDIFLLKPLRLIVSLIASRFLTLNNPPVILSKRVQK